MLKFRIRKLKLSPEARAFIAHKIERNLDEGKDPKQAQAIAYSQAREEGYRVPKPKDGDGGDI